MTQKAKKFDYSFVGIELHVKISFKFWKLAQYFENPGRPEKKENFI